MQILQSRRYASRPTISEQSPARLLRVYHLIARTSAMLLFANNDDDVCRCTLVSFDTAARDDSRDFIPSRVTLSVTVREFQPRILSPIREADAATFGSILLLLRSTEFKRYEISLRYNSPRLTINCYKSLTVLFHEVIE